MVRQNEGRYSAQKRNLIVAPHTDDDILGVGGTIAKKAKNGEDVMVCIVTSRVGRHYSDENAKENVEQYVKALSELGNIKKVFLNFPTLEINIREQVQINNELERIISDYNPDELYLPHWGDIHIEHKNICNATLVAARPHRNDVKKIYAYETISETCLDAPTGHNAFIPTAWEDITETLEIKVRAMKKFKQQIDEDYGPRSEHAIRTLAGFRGSQISKQYAEAFEIIREIR